MSSQPLALPDESPVLRVMPMPESINPNGDVFGGWVMSQIDLAGGITAARRAKGRIVTVAVNALQFKQPISVGDVLSFYAQITSTGRTSVTVEVQVYAERNFSNPTVVKVTEATLTFVAIHDDGSKRELPPAP